MPLYSNTGLTFSPQTDAASAAPSDAELFPLIEKHFGMVPRRDDTVIDRRNGRFHDAQRYRDFAADLLSARAQPTPPAVVEPLTEEQIVGVMHSIPINAAPSYHIAFARAIEAANGIKGGQHGTE